MRIPIAEEKCLAQSAGRTVPSHERTIDPCEYEIDDVALSEDTSESRKIEEWKTWTKVALSICEDYSEWDDETDIDTDATNDGTSDSMAQYKHCGLCGGKTPCDEQMLTQIQEW